MKISQRGIDFVKEHEKRDKDKNGIFTAYDDGTGTWTIGYGHTRGVKKGQVINEEQAMKLLNQDMDKHTERVNRLVKTPLTQNQFDALTSFDFNTGGLRYKDKKTNKLVDSKVLTALNEGNIDHAFRVELPQWNKLTLPSGEKVESKGLTNRRNFETQLAYHDENNNASSPIATGMLDYLINKGGM
jgi:lysozyme